MKNKDTFYTGSKLIIDSETLVLLVNSLVDDYRNACTKKDLNVIEVHNKYTLYTVLMLIYLTGHREVSDPFYSIDLFDLDNQAVIIEDKAVSDTHMARLAWLSDVACKQLENYLSHLKALSRRIYSTNSKLSTMIWAITEENGFKPMPLFFFINKDGKKWERLSPKIIKSALKNKWELPLNSNRHILSKWLEEQNCPAELIDAQLGHIESGCSPFGNNSVLSPPYVSEKLAPYLMDYLKVHNWMLLEGLSGIKGLKKPKMNLVTFENIQLGPELRAKDRHARWLNDAKEVEELFSDLTKSGLPKQITDEEISHLESQLYEKAKSSGNRVLIRLTLFRRLILKYRRNGVKVRLPGRLSVAKVEPSPFRGDSQGQSKKSVYLRKTFLQYLHNQEGKKLELERRIAEILISSILYGALLSKSFQDQLPDRIKDGFGLENGVAYINFLYHQDQPESTQRRYLPDPITLSLLTGLYRQTPINSNDITDTSKIKENIIDIFEKISFKYQRQRSIKHDHIISNTLNSLTIISRSFWRLRLPGVLRAYTEDHRFSASITSSNLHRLLTGDRSCSIDNESTGKIANNSVYTETTTDNIAPGNSNLQRSKEIWSDLAEALNIESIKEKKPAPQKHVLEARIQSIKNDNSSSMSPITSLLINWLLHLCKNKTSHNRDLRASSISTYAGTIGKLLIEQGYKLNILFLSDTGFEDLYHRIAEASLQKNVGYVVERLKEFHYFLTKCYACPSIDWDEVYDGDNLTVVDSAIITLEEYKQSWKLLSEDPYSTEREKRVNLFILLLAYRFGLRTGEIFRLTGGDITFLKDQIVVYVRNSTYGFTKNDNGVRQIPLLEPISSEEYQLIIHWIDHIESYAENFSLSALLSKYGKEKDIIDRTNAIERVIEAIRLSTGEQSIRIRHLRHSYATRNFLYVYCENIPHSLMGIFYNSICGKFNPKHARKILLGRDDLSYRGMYAIAVAQGHGSPKTTFKNYIHILDIAVYDYVNHYTEKGTDKAIAYSLQASPDNVRQIHRRKRDIDNIGQWLAPHFLPKIEANHFKSRWSRSSTPLILNENRSLTDRKYFDSSSIDRMLSVAGVRKNIDGFTECFLIPESAIREILSIGSLLQEETGFNDFALPDFSPGNNWLPKTITRYEKLDKESIRVRNYLSEIKHTEETNKSIQQLGDIWKNSFSPSSSVLLLKNRDDFRIFIEAVKQLGFNTTDFEIILPNTGSDEQHSVWNSIYQELTNSGYKVTWRTRLPLSNDHEPNNRIGLILRPSTSHSIGYQRTFNRIIFVLICWIRTHTMIDK